MALNVFFFLVILIGSSFGQTNETIKAIGASCRDDSDCNSPLTLMCFGGTPTTDGICGCKYTLKQVGSNCVAFANGECAPTLGCTENSVCIGGKCTCQTRFEISHSTASGLLAGPECRLSHTQICRELQPDVTYQCNHDLGLECKAQTTRNCECKANTIWSAVRNRCIGLNQACTKDNDCFENGICAGRLCKCIDGYEFNVMRGIDICLPGLGTQCRSSDHNPRCGYKLSCGTNNICQCETGKIVQNGVCKHLVDQTCSATVDCVTNAICDRQSSCKCSNDLRAIETSAKTCERIPLWQGNWNNNCLDDRDCTFSKFAYCKRETNEPFGKCDCGAPYQIDIVDMVHTCAAAPKTACRDNQECAGNSQCIDDVCECIPNTELVGSVCQWRRTFSSVCTEVETCNHHVGLECIDGSCACPQGQVYSQPLARCISLVAGRCGTNNTQCVENSYCNDLGNCICDDGYSVTSTRRCKLTHYQDCNVTAQVTNPCNEEKFLKCIDNQCQCEYGDQQIFDGGSGECKSVRGGFCGILSDYNQIGLIRNMSCIGDHSCRANLLGISTCVPDSVSTIAGSFAIIISFLSSILLL